MLIDCARQTNEGGTFSLSIKVCDVLQPESQRQNANLHIKVISMTKSLDALGSSGGEREGQPLSVRTASSSWPRNKYKTTYYVASAFQ